MLSPCPSRALPCPSRWPRTVFINSHEHFLGPPAAPPNSSCCRCVLHSAPGSSICRDDMVQPQPRGEWSSGSGFYYGPNDKTFCASMHRDSAPTAAREPVQSSLVSVLLTTVTGCLESGIFLVMVFPSCPSLIFLKVCSALPSPFVWAEFGTAFLSWANPGWNFEIHPLPSGMPQTTGKLLRWFGLPKDTAFSLIQEGKDPFPVWLEYSLGSLPSLELEAGRMHNCSAPHSTENQAGVCSPSPGCHKTHQHVQDLPSAKRNKK